jgi:thiol:disulfide interchange protein DsbD
MIKIDLTRKGDPINEYLLRLYDVRGVPTVVFLDRNGREHPELRLVRYMPPAEFLERMVEITKSGF